MKRILIVGAGVAGTDVLREINQVIGFSDDDLQKRDAVILGSKVLGGIDQISSIIDRKKIEEVIVAIPSADGEKIARYVEICAQKKVVVMIVPRVKEIIEGKAHLNTLRRVKVEDLLGRPVVKDDVHFLKVFFREKTILITGAAGSIGSELSRQVVAYNPRRIVFVDWWENGMFYLKQSIEKEFPKAKVIFVIGNIQNKTKMDRLFNKYHFNYVFHAAAYKHVPAMEENPEEAVENNIFGTVNLARISLRYSVERFVCISTDKAADPKSVMGMTKLIAERVASSLNGKKTKFIKVRFGNVLDSFGSVVPIFRRQIEEGGPVTVTDKRMTRYFMTIPEAVQLILKASYLGKGGELFVLDMGRPIRILDLAEQMIRLSGLVPYKEMPIIFTGKRRGEKLHERLFTKDEKLATTTMDKIYIASPNGKRPQLKQELKKLKNLMKTGDGRLLINYLKLIS